MYHPSFIYWGTKMRKSILIDFFILIIIVMVLISGCTTKDQSSDTVIRSTPTTILQTPAQPTSTIDIQKSNDIKFLSEAAKSNDEMTLAVSNFNNVVSEVSIWYSNVQNAESAYQNALEYLESEQAIADTITSRYLSNLQRAGNDVSYVRTLTIQHNQDIAEVNSYIAAAQTEVDRTNTARTTAIKKPMDLEAKGLDIKVLNTTSAQVINKLSPLPVSSELQPVKDQYLAAMSSYRNAGDTFEIAVNYYKIGKLSDGDASLEKATTYIKSAKNQIDSCNLKLHQYKNKIGD